MTDTLDRLLAQVAKQNDAGKRPAGKKIPRGEIAPAYQRRQRKPRTIKTREPRTDTVRTAKYICGFFDETDRTLYLVGGLGTAEQMAHDLMQEGHTIRMYDGPSANSPKEYVRIISKNHRTRYGARLGKDLEGWDKAVVVRGTAEFYFLLHNTTGRKSKVRK